MSYKTIVVHVHPSAHMATTVRQASRLAKAFNAHLVGSAFSGLTFGERAATPLYSPVGLKGEMEAIHDKNNAALALFDSIASAEGVLTYERRLSDDEPVGGLAFQARYADLMVVSQTDFDEPASAQIIGALPEQLALDGGRPVVVVPCASSRDHIGTRVLVAWDGSMEASRALAFGLPLLQAARLVTVALFHPDEPQGRDPGADIALYLARHGVRCEVRSIANRLRDSDPLLSLVDDLQADLIVMGCYGHSRFREIMLGGVTESILTNMTVPVLMAH